MVNFMYISFVVLQKSERSEVIQSDVIEKRESLQSLLVGTFTGTADCVFQHASVNDGTMNSASCLPPSFVVALIVPCLTIHILFRRRKHTGSEKWGF